MLHNTGLPTVINKSRA